MTADHETMTAERIAELQKLCASHAMRADDCGRVAKELSFALATIASQQAALAVARDCFWKIQHGKIVQEDGHTVVADLSSDEIANLVAVAISRIDAALKGAHPARERVRHLKRGSTYEVLHRGVTLQTERPISDFAELVVYRGEKGLMWARPTGEFDDGRFEHIAQGGEDVG